MNLLLVFTLHSLGSGQIRILEMGPWAGVAYFTFNADIYAWPACSM